MGSGVVVAVQPKQAVEAPCPCIVSQTPRSDDRRPFGRTDAGDHYEGVKSSGLTTGQRALAGLVVRH